MKSVMRKSLHIVLALSIGLLIGLSTTVAAETKEYVQAAFAKFNFVVNGEVVELGADPLVYQDSTYLPVRAVLNALGYDVGYLADSRTITADKSIDSLMVEFEGVITSRGDSVSESPEKNIEEQLAELRARLASLNEQKASLEIKMQEIRDNPGEEQEWALSARQPILDSLNGSIERIEAQIADLESQSVE